MREALATACQEYARCWRPVPVPDGFPFVSSDVAAAWAFLFVLCLIVFVRRLLN